MSNQGGAHRTSSKPPGQPLTRRQSFDRSGDIAGLSTSIPEVETAAGCWEKELF
jgi:hypothetical protein